MALPGERDRRGRTDAKMNANVIDPKALSKEMVMRRIRAAGEAFAAGDVEMGEQLMRETNEAAKRYLKI